MTSHLQEPTMELIVGAACSDGQVDDEDVLITPPDQAAVLQLSASTSTTTRTVTCAEEDKKPLKTQRTAERNSVSLCRLHGSHTLPVCAMKLMLSPCLCPSLSLSSCLFPLLALALTCNSARYIYEPTSTVCADLHMHNNPPSQGGEDKR